MKRAISRLTGIIIVIIVIVAIIAAWYALFGGGGPAAVTTTTTKTTVTTTTTATTMPTGIIKVGFTTSLTGSYAVEGTRQLHGIQLWQYWVNNKTGGIIVNGTRYFIKIIYYDDASKKDQVTALYEKLITQDNVDFLISPYSSPLALTAAAIAEAHSKVIVTTGAAADSIHQQGYKYVVQVYTPGSEYLWSTLDLIKAKDPSAKKIAIVYSDDVFSASVAEGAKKYAEQNGFTVVFYDKYPSTATDLSPILTSIKATNPDAIIGGGHFADGVLLIKQAKQLNVNAKLFSIIVAAPEDSFYQSLGADANYIFGPSQWEPDVKYNATYGPSVKDFIQMYKSMFNETPTYHSAGGFMAGLVLQAAIEKAQSLNSKKVRDAFNTLDLKTFFGEFKIDPVTGLQIAHKMVLIQWQNGKKYTVWPPEAASAQPLYPKPAWG
ncbi:MAG: amino acid ABC transporter substrate-binding protein [Thermoprotei archaeon]